MSKVFKHDEFMKVFSEKGYTLGNWLDELRLSANGSRTLALELKVDHATTKTAVDEIHTAVDEFVDDHAVIKTLGDELIADHATFITVITDLKTLANAIKASFTAGLISNPTLAIGSTVQNVSNVAFFYMIAGTIYAKVADAVGVAPGNDVIPQNKYGAVALDIGVNGTIDVIEAANNATGYDSAVLAVAGLAAVEASHVRMGTVTAMDTDGTFTFGTTSLAHAGAAVAYINGSVGIAVGGSTVTTSAPAALSASGLSTLTATKPTAGPAALSAGDPSAVPFAFGV